MKKEKKKFQKVNWPAESRKEKYTKNVSKKKLFGAHNWDNCLPKSSSTEVDLRIETKIPF